MYCVELSNRVLAFGGHFVPGLEKAFLRRLSKSDAGSVEMSKTAGVFSTQSGRYAS